MATQACLGDFEAEKKEEEQNNQEAEAEADPTTPEFWGPTDTQIEKVFDESPDATLGVDRQ